MEERQRNQLKLVSGLETDQEVNAKKDKIS